MKEWDGLCVYCGTDDVLASYRIQNEEITYFECRECSKEFTIKTEIKYYIK